MVSLRNFSAAAASTIAASGMLANVALAEPQDLVTNGPNNITVSTTAIDQALNKNCQIYTNVLGIFDRNHINGATSVPHSKMATIALKGAARAAVLNSDRENKPTSNEDRFDLAFSMTFVDGTTLTPTKAGEGIQGYDDHCNYLSAPFKTLSDKTGVPVKDLYSAGINAVISETRDPHSSYIPPREATGFREQTRGNFVGIGIEIGKDEQGYLDVKGIIEGGSAEKAGLQKGDIVTHVDGQSLKDMSMEEAVKKIKGEPDTEVNLTIKRGDAEPFDQAVARAIVIPKVVTGKMVGDTLHVTVKTFNEQTYKQFVEAIAAGMAEWSGKNAMNLEKVVIDVRNNPGGLLDEVNAMIDRLIHQDDPEVKKQIMATGKSASELNDKLLNDSLVPVNFPKFKISVLTNGGSASASEILAGALVDEGHDVVGSRSYGKGSVQTIIPLARGRDGLARVTTSAFFPGSSVLSNQGAGIPPTVKVVYGDFRDEQVANRPHESDREGSLIPAGQTREGIKPKFTCTLSSDLSGLVTDEKIADLASDFTKSVILRREERSTGQRPTEADWERFAGTERGQGIIEESNTKYIEYVGNFVHKAVRPTGNQDVPYEFVQVMDADRLCAQHKLDGEQEITFNGKPITTIKAAVPNMP